VQEHPLSRRTASVPQLSWRFLTLSIDALLPNVRGCVFHCPDHKVLPSCGPLIGRGVEAHEVEAVAEEIRCGLRNRAVEGFWGLFLEVDMGGWGGALEVATLLLDRALKL
jgi:hypothetical protein